MGLAVRVGGDRNLSQLVGLFAVVRGQPIVSRLGSRPPAVWIEAVDEGCFDPSHTEARMAYDHALEDRRWPIYLTPVEQDRRIGQFLLASVNRPAARPDRRWYPEAK